MFIQTVLRRLAPKNRRCFWYSILSQTTKSPSLLCPLYVRCLTHTIQPMEEDLNPVVSRETLDAYETVYTRYQSLVEQAYNGGGAKGIERHVHRNKKMLVRDRIKLLIDPGTDLFELGTLAGFNLPYGDIPMAGHLAGIGQVNGIYCMIGGSDATVKAGAIFPSSIAKTLRLQQICDVNRLPCIYIPDSGGAFLPLQSLMFVHGGRHFYNQAVMSSKGIPQIAIVCGSCTAGGAYTPTMSDEAIIVDSIGKIFLGGPPLVQAALGEIVSAEDLGGAFMHSSVSGCTDYYVETEKEAFQICRDIVEGLNFQSIKTTSFDEPAYELASDLKYFAAKNHLSKADLYALLGSVLDKSHFKEFKAFFGPGLITGVGYIQGLMVGIVGNADAIRSAEALKGAHFLDLCNRRRIPILFLQNSLSPEVLNKESYLNYFDTSILRDRAKFSAVLATLNVPTIALTLTACYQDDLLLLCGPSFHPNFSFMWPSSRLSFSDMETVDSNSEEDGILDAFMAAANMIIDEVIPPNKTRTVIGHTLRILSQMQLNDYEPNLRSPILRM